MFVWLVAVKSASSYKCVWWSDSNKPSDKTNGSADPEETESNKDTATESNEKPADTTSKDSSIDKNHSKEEDSHSSQDDLESKTLKEDNESSKTTNSAVFKDIDSPHETRDNVDIKENCLPDNKLKGNPKDEHLNTSKDTESDLMKSTPIEKTNVVTPKDKESEVAHSNESASKDTSVDAEDKEEEKGTENSRQSLEDETLDTVASKDSTNDIDIDKTRALDFVDESPIPTKPISRKKSPSKIKQKAPDDSPKPRGRKKAAKLEFGSGDEGKSQRQAPERMSSRTNRQTRQGLSLEDFIVSDDEEWQTETDRSRPKRRRKRGSKRGDESGSDWETDHKKVKKTPQKTGSGSESGSDWGLHNKGKKGLKGKKRKGKQSTSDALSEEETTSANAITVKKTRIPCTYGKKCFRRNPNHLDQFCHPGDSDYTSDVEEIPKNDAISDSEEETVSTKKECPYGANCFRKNPQHKKDFKHTKKVRPQREAAKIADKKAKGSSNSDEIDSYDLDESLRDDSADEYKPADSGSDYESGKKPKRLLKGKVSGKAKRGRKA